MMNEIDMDDVYVIAAIILALVIGPLVLLQGALFSGFTLIIYGFYILVLNSIYR